MCREADKTKEGRVGDLTDKRILVTGAARGIGRATALLLKERGARVVVHASGPSESAKKAAAALGLAEDDFLFEDFSALGAGDRLFARALEKAGGLDGLVNNAGAYIETALGADDERWRKSWRDSHMVNVQAPADLCRAAIAHFRGAGRGGVIVNLASRAGHRGDGPDYAGYAAAKAGVIAMTKTWARALAGEEILLYAIAPGWVETRMAPQDIAARQEAVKDIPLGRVAQPEEVAAICAFLLSGAAPSATGSTIDINGASYVR